MCQHGIQLMTKTRRLALIGGVLLGLAFLMFVLSSALPSWGVGEAKGISVNAGLWRGCIKFNNKTDHKECGTSLLTCKGVPKLFLGQCMKLITTRTFIILACIFSAFGTMVLLTICITGRNNSTLIKCGKALNTGSLICGVIGFAVGISWALYGFGQLAAAAILAIVATAMNLFSVAVVLAIPKQEV